MGLPHVGEKTKFSPDQGKVREFEKMSGNFGHLTHVREFCDVVSENCWEILS